MNWSLVVGPACFLIGMLVTLYVKDSAREVAKNQFAESIASALAIFKNDLLQSLDKVYVRTNLCDLMMDAQMDRSDIATKRLDSLDVHIENIKNKTTNNRDKR